MANLLGPAQKMDTIFLPSNTKSNQITNSIDTLRSLDYKTKLSTPLQNDPS